jgi:exopolyphosphatase/guanosine-5'-triphosphate,3'-diphosphate pyrophosphatase
LKLSLIDLGTNSVRYDVYELKDGQARRLHREKRMVRLGDGVFEHGRLDAAALARTAAALTEFSALNRHYHVEKTRAVTTAAMRGASDAQAALERLQAALGYPLEVLSGDDEAALIAEGVLGSESHLPAGAYILIDIGGGSTELSLCQGKERLEGASLDLGANRLQQHYLKSLPPVKDGVAKLRQHAQSVLASFRNGHRWPAVKELIGSSGSIRALRKIAKAAGVKDQPFTLHFVQTLNQRIQGYDRLALLHMPGMDEKRVDLLLAGSLLLQEALTAFGAKKVRVTDASLREGLLIHELKHWLR